MALMRFPACLLPLLLGSLATAQIRTLPPEELLQEQAVTDSSSLRFEVLTLRDGPLAEDGGRSRYVFPFTNEGTEPVEILSIGSNCSCVRALQGVGRVAPGESSKVVMEFDPSGHPGRFSRKLFVRSDEASRPVAVLTLEVEVLSSDPLAAYYPVDMGCLRLRRDTVSFRAGEKAVESIRVVNVAGRPFRPEFETAFLPSCLKVSCEPLTLAPGQEGMIEIRYEAGERALPGGSGAHPGGNGGNPGENGAHPGGDAAHNGKDAALKLMLRDTGAPPSRSVIFIEIKK